MGLHSPFGYVGYGVTMGKILINLLDDLCGSCHTNDDYCKGCHECPAGQLIYECKEYLLNLYEPDKNYELYTSEEWQAGREKMYGKRDSDNEIEQNRQLALQTKPESDIIRAIKTEIVSIEPHPFFHSQWIWENKRAPDPLLKLRELVKDAEFQNEHRYEFLMFGNKVDKVFRQQKRKIFDRARLKYEQKLKKTEVK